jgi:hypothetical protein
MAPFPRNDPEAVELILKMVGHSGPTQAKILDNSIIDKRVREGYINGVYK